MAIPTIATITPDEGLACGHTLVEISGTNFRTRAASFHAPPFEAYSTVQVLFNGVEALYAQAQSSGLIRCLTPQYQGTYRVTEHAPVDVIVRNLNDSGAPIALETVTLEDAFSYLRLPLSPPDPDPPMMQVLRKFIELLRREVGAQVAISTSPDFADENSDYIVVAKHPSINLRVEEQHDKDWAQWDTTPITYNRGDGTFDHYTMVKHYRLELDLLLCSGATADGAQHVGQRLKSDVNEMLMANPYLLVPPDPRMPLNPTSKYPMEVAKEARQTAGPNQSGVVAYDMAVSIRGIPVVLSSPKQRVRGISEVYLGMAVWDAYRSSTHTVVALVP